jgi:hypothetical protein
MDHDMLIKRLAVLLALLAMPTIALAYSIDFSAHVKCTNGNTVVEQGGPSFPGASCQETTNRGGFFPLQGETKADADTRFGPRSVGVMAHASADITNGVDTFQAEASASSSVQDTFIMSATLPDGTPITSGLFDVNLVATGFATLSSTQTAIPNFAELTYSLSIGTFSLPNTITLTPPTDSQGIGVPVNVVSIPWTAGVPLSVSMSASASVSAAIFGEGSSDAEIIFGNSFDWLGIVNVTDEFGNPAAAFSAIGEDGLDWGSPAAVPLPASVWLFTSALGVFGFAGWRKKKKAD